MRAISRGGSLDPPERAVDVAHAASGIGSRLLVTMAVAAGVMETGPNNAFQPSKAVTGAEAVMAVARIEALSGDGK